MSDRKSPELVVEGLSTTADKIRALAKAGYLRTEISKILDIRYQHVRHVLVRSGIELGLQRSVELERSSDTVEISESEREAVPIPLLLESGFRPGGEWQLVDGSLKLSKRVPAGPGVYAFVVDGNVVYIGVTHNGLQTRMDQYRRGHNSQRTSARVNNLISESVAAGHRVETFVAEPPDSEWNGLPIDGSAGLEVGLIELIQPIWNMRGVK